MPEQVIPNPQPPGANFIGLQPYTEAQSGCFYGRDKEIEQLTKLVEANTLTILFGKSGAGKTSILNAGAFPRLRQNFHLPFPIRLDFEHSPDTLVHQVKNAVKKSIDDYKFRVENYPSADETLWEYFHKESLWKTVTPILVFDQFEEIFTLAPKNPRYDASELNAFWDEMSDLIENYIPKKLTDKFLNHKEEIDYNYKTQKVKVVFAFREEYLAEFESFAVSGASENLESITNKIPSIKLSRMRLMPLTGSQALEVIIGSWGNKVDPDQEAKRIVYYCTSETEGEKSIDTITGIEPSLLSQVITIIEKERLKQGLPKVTKELLDRSSKDFTLRLIYDEAIVDANLAIQQNLERQEGSQSASSMRNQGDQSPATVPVISDFIQEKLIDEDGKRRKIILENRDQLLLPGIQEMDQKFIVRVDEVMKEDRKTVDYKTVELAHDVLCPLILADRDKRRKQMALDESRRRALRKFKRILLGIIIAALAFIIGTYFITKPRIDTFNKFSDWKDSLKNRKPDTVRIPDSSKILPVKSNCSDTCVDLVTLKMRLKEDSIKIDSLQNIIFKEREKYLAQQTKDKETIVLLSAKLATANATIASLQQEMNDLNKQITYLNNQVAFYKGQWERSQDRVKKLADSLAACKANCPIIPPVPPDRSPDSKSFVLDFVYKGMYKDFDKMNIYLVPDDNAHKKLIRENKEMDITCDPAKMDKAPGVYKAMFSKQAQQYFFDNVKNGQYLLKVCTLYGTYKTMFVTQGSLGSKRIWLVPPFK